MRISSISAKTAFLGTVIMDKEKIAKEIANTMENDQKETLIQGIKSMQKRLQDETPDNKIYIIDYKRAPYKSNYEPSKNRYFTLGEDAEICVYDENFKAVNRQFFLSERSSRFGYWNTTKKAKKEEIEQTFDKVTEDVVLNSHKKYNPKETELSGDVRKIFDELV